MSFSLSFHSVSSSDLRTHSAALAGWIHASVLQGVDIFGQVIPHAPTERVHCMHCDWEGAAARYFCSFSPCCIKSMFRSHPDRLDYAC